MRLNCFWMHATYRQVRLSGGFTIFQYIPGNLRLTNYPVICPKNKWLHSRKAKPKKRYRNLRRNLRCFRIEFSRLFCSNIALPWNSQLFHLERKSKKWCLRKQGQPQECRRFKTETLGRIPTIFLDSRKAKLYYLRMLLHNVRGQQSFNDLVVEWLGCLWNFSGRKSVEDWVRWRTILKRVMEESASIRFGSELREVFSTILLFYATPSNPKIFWLKWKEILAVDLVRRGKVSTVTPEVRNYILSYIKSRLDWEDMCPMRNFGILLPKDNAPDDMSQFVKEELNHQLDHLFKEVQQADNFLNAEQSVVYKNEIWSVENNFGKTYRMNACSSTGKSKEIHSKVRSLNKIALATALSGIASTLPRSGRTLHSRSKVPLDIREYSVCLFSRRDATGKLMQHASLLVIDGVSMGNKYIFECLDRSLQDVRGTKSLLAVLQFFLQVTGDKFYL